MVNFVKIIKYAKPVYYVAASVATSISAAKGAIELKNAIQKEQEKKKKKKLETLATES